MRKLLLALSLMLVPAAALPGAASATAIGMGDQSPQLFSNEYFTALTKVRVVRYIAPWDVELVPAERAKADTWIAAARAKGYLVHLTFNYGARNPRKNPTVAQFTSATKAFVKRQKANVETWGVFNEVNRGKTPNFTTPDAKLAGQLFTAFRTKVCKGCRRIVGIDVLDGQTVGPTLKYIKAFLKATKGVKPKIWGIHDYSDVNRSGSGRTKALVKLMRPGQVWLTETGGLYRLGTTFAPNELRQAEATKQVFAIAKKFPTIKRVYFYNFFAPPADDPNQPFDAGMIRPDGTPRPAYDVFASYVK